MSNSDNLKYLEKNELLEIIRNMRIERALLEKENRELKRMFDEAMELEDKHYGDMLEYRAKCEFLSNIIGAMDAD